MYEIWLLLKNYSNYNLSSLLNVAACDLAPSQCHRWLDAYMFPHSWMSWLAVTQVIPFAMKNNWHTEILWKDVKWMGFFCEYTHNLPVYWYFNWWVLIIITTCCAPSSELWSDLMFGLSLNRHQTILGVYVNKFGKTSVVWRYTLQSIGPSGIALNH